MIAELPDGTELRFPDTMTDAQVGAVVKRILAAEREAKQARADAESAIAQTRADMEALRSKVEAMLAAPKPPVMVNNEGLLGALQAMHADLKGVLERVVKAQLADTILVRDETGDAIRSKKVVTK